MLLASRPYMTIVRTFDWGVCPAKSENTHDILVKGVYHFQLRNLPLGCLRGVSFSSGACWVRRTLAFPFSRNRQHVATLCNFLHFREFLDTRLGCLVCLRQGRSSAGCFRKTPWTAERLAHPSEPRPRVQPLKQVTLVPHQLTQRTAHTARRQKCPDTRSMPAGQHCGADENTRAPYLRLVFQR